MAWLKRDEEVVVTEELEFSNSSISKTDAYEIEITEAYLSNAKDKSSKSVSLVISGKTKDDETIRTFFTLMGRDGKTFFISKVGNTEVKKQHFGLSIANTVFGIAINKEIFDVEPKSTKYEVYNKETKEREVVEGDGFPDLIGKVVGVTVQMTREIDGANSKEYATIEHFFDVETGLFYGEESSEKTKLDKWLSKIKDFKIIEKKEQKSSFSKKEKSEEQEQQPVKRGWGKK